MHLDNVDAMLEAIDSLIDMGRLDEAERMLQVALSQAPNDARLLASLSRLNLNRGNFQRARQHARETIGAEPEWSQGYFLLVLASLYDDYFVPKAEDLRGMQVEPGKSERRIAFAEQHIQSGLRCDPLNPALHLLSGEIKMLTNHFSDALRAANQGLEYAPDYVPCHHLRIRALAAMNRRDEALEAAQQVLRMAPNDAESHRLLSILSRGRGDLEAAVKHGNEAVRLDPTSQSTQAAYWESARSRSAVVRGYTKWQKWQGRVHQQSLPRRAAIFGAVFVASVLIEVLFLGGGSRSIAIVPVVFTAFLCFCDPSNWPIPEFLLAFDRQYRTARGRGRIFRILAIPLLIVLVSASMVLFRTTKEIQLPLAIWAGASLAVPWMVRSLVIEPSSRRTASVSMAVGLLTSTAGIGLAFAEMNRAAVIAMSLGVAINLLGAGFAYAIEETRRTQSE